MMKKLDTRFQRIAAAVITTSLVATLGACARKVVSTPEPQGATIGPSLVIEAFLKAANANDLDTMAKLFGTKEGPFDRIGSRKEIDNRMFTFATVLRHTDFKVKGEGDPVMGRRNEAKNILVDLTLKDGRVTVPFRVVQYKNSWLIEDLCMNKLLNPVKTCGEGE